MFNLRKAIYLICLFQWKRRIPAIKYGLAESTVEPRYNEGLGDWQNLFATRFHFIEVLFHVFHHYCGKKQRSSYRGRRFIEVRFFQVPLYYGLFVSRRFDCFSSSGSLINDVNDENNKKAIALEQHNNNFARVSGVFVHFFTVVARPRREVVRFLVLLRKWTQRFFKFFF